MDIKDMKRAVFFSTPSGMTTDKRITWSFDALAAGAKSQNIEFPPKREFFAMLREIGFTDAKVDGERRIAATLPIFASIVVPIVNGALAQLEREASK